jgi:tetratricopeptide (TPR) repeat protein
MDPNQDTLFSNRGLCYLHLRKNKQAILDLAKAINLNPHNIKALKRLAHVKTNIGELAEAEIYLKRCYEIEPNIEKHKEDLDSIKELIIALDEMNKSKFVHDYKKCEAICEKLFNKKVETIQVKQNYLECLIKNDNIEKALKFIKSDLNDEEKKMEDFVYLASLANYYEGK